ncbi:MFS transporter, UMF1 family [Streptomyces sp. SolWspMP-sol7th]|nr:MFS transporter, UMF1 family [Streptomyces sp. SolWspMP-sol7th]
MIATGAADEAGARKREQRGWYFYDWACSVYSTSVLTVFLGPYLTEVAKSAADADGYVHPLGLPVRAGSFFAYSVSLSVIVSVLVMPLAGALADRTGRKKPLLGAAAYLGAAATAGMFFLGGDRYLLGGVLLVVANASIAVSTVVYNAFLPQIAAPDERDAVSSRGWAFGYAAGALVLVLNLVLYLGHDSFGVSESTAVRTCLSSAGLWWGVFTLVPLRRLRERPAAAAGAGGVGGSWRQLGATLKDMRRRPVTLWFLLAYLLYNDGIQTVISQASVFGSEELGLSQSTLIVAILLVQVLAVAGALGMGRLALRYGTKRTVLASLGAWTVIVACGYFLPAGAPVVVLRPRRGHRADHGRQPGALALALLPSGARGQGGRVLLRVRDERPRHELARPAALRGHLPGHGELPGRDHLAGDLLRARFRRAAAGAARAWDARGGEHRSRGRGGPFPRLRTICADFARGHEGR